MWNLKYKITPVITAATGIVTKGLRNSLEGKPVECSVHSVQKTAVLGTSHIIWEVLQSET